MTPPNDRAPTESRAITPVEQGGPEIAVGSQRQAAPILGQARETIFPGARPSHPGAPPIPRIGPLNLEPGEWVEVRPLGQIREMLDGQRRYKGLYFMPEMERYCGGTFRVFKKVKTIKLESTGEVRRMRGPIVLLEGVYCDGERHGGCDRACLHLWREAWLGRIADPESPPGSSSSAPGI